MDASLSGQAGEAQLIAAHGREPTFILNKMVLSERLL